MAATDADDRVTDDSVHGAHVDLAAPGRDVLTAWGAWGDCYLSQDGESTSYATAYVSGAAALVAQRFPHDGPGGVEAAARGDGGPRAPRRPRRRRRMGRRAARRGADRRARRRHRRPARAGRHPRTEAAAGTAVVEVGSVADPLVGDRRQVLWVGIAVGAAVLGLALLRLVRRRPTA